MEINNDEKRQNMDQILSLIQRQKQKIYERIHKYNENKLEIDMLLFEIERERNYKDVFSKAREVLRKETANNVIMQTLVNSLQLFENTVSAYVSALDIPIAVFTLIGFNQIEKKVNELFYESEQRFQSALKVWGNSVNRAM